MCINIQTMLPQRFENHLRIKFNFSVSLINIIHILGHFPAQIIHKTKHICYFQNCTYVGKGI